MEIERFRDEDAEEVSALIVHTLRTVNIRDYSGEYIEDLVRRMQPDDIRQRAAWTHLYVARDGERIVGCGAVGPWWDSEEESGLFTVFVLPECQGRGIGRAILGTLEKDGFFLRAKRVEVPASITAEGFYRKLGYVPKPGAEGPDEEGLIRLEKRRPEGSGTGVEIRKCREADVPRTGAFYDAVVAWLDGHVNYPRWVRGIYPSERTVRAASEAGEQYICESGGRIVGAFVLNTDPQGRYEKAAWSRDLPEGSYLVLHALAAAPEERRKGVASEIIRFCTEKARKQGFLALRADVVPGNVPARRLFEKNGFSCAGDADLERGIEGIPVFTLYERSW